MNEIVGSILNAEKEAERIVSEASEKGKAAVLNGETRAEEIRERAVSEFSEERKNTLAQAEARAEAVYGEMLENGKAAATAFKAKCEGKIESAAEESVGRIFG